MAEVNRGNLDNLVHYLSFWETRLYEFGEYRGLARDLITRCRQDYAAGGEGPGPWLAMADLIEECFDKTLIRPGALNYYLPLSQEGSDNG